MISILAFLLLAAPAGSFTGELWADIRPIYARTLAHPFLKGLTDGTLPKPKFQFYLQQDALYLRAFGQALNLLAAKAPREDWAITLSTHAIEAIRTEREMHESILKSYGITRPAAAMAPTNYAYTNHLLVAVGRGSFAEGLAALLPCYWIYLEVGRDLKKKGAPDRDYQRWIDLYSGDEYAKNVAQVLEMMNREAAKLDAAGKQRAAELFKLSARYEYLFWDMAWREERWRP